jgi:hypothetical protein
MGQFTTAIPSWEGNQKMQLPIESSFLNSLFSGAGLQPASGGLSTSRRDCDRAGARGSGTSRPGGLLHDQK